MFERYSKKAMETVFSARYEAKQSGSPEIRTEHILLALLNDPTITTQLMAGIPAEEVRQEVVSALPQPKPAVPASDPPLLEESRRVLLIAEDEASKAPNRQVVNEHILLGLLRLPNSSCGGLLERRGLSADAIRQHIVRLQSEAPAPPSQVKEDLTPNELAGRAKMKALVLQLFDLSRKGKHRDALKLLDQAMAEPGAEPAAKVRVLSPIAAIISQKTGDLRLVRKYCEKTVACDPENPMALYALADCLALQGEEENAKKYALRCYELSLARPDSVGPSIIELLEKRFPDVTP